MKLKLTDSTYILTEQGIDLSIPLKTGTDNVNAWYCDPVSIEPVVAEGFVGDVNQGGAVNFKNIKLNPHGNGTHTECVGHISKENYTINQCLKEFHFLAQLVSVRPEIYRNTEFGQDDFRVDVEELKTKTKNWSNEKAIIIRTLDNPKEKKAYQYSGTNPIYYTKEAIEHINKLGVEHLMVDLPSIDREEDHGELIGHRTFWNYPDNPLTHKTISELLYIPDELKDGKYLVQIQIMSIENDASPSKIVAHQIYEEK